MVLLGIILLVIGFVADIAILSTIGVHSGRHRARPMDPRIARSTGPRTTALLVDGGSRAYPFLAARPGIRTVFACRTSARPPCRLAGTGGVRPPCGTRRGRRSAESVVSCASAGRASA